MTKRCLLPALFALLVPFLAAQEDAVDLVDMRLGLLGEGNCVIGPQLPNGSINPSPQTPQGGHGGYHPGNPVRGFGQLHATGTGWGCYGQMLLSPQVGLAVGETEHDSVISQEVPRPYAYACTLDRYGIRVELAPAHDAAIYRITFPSKPDCSLILDAAHSLAEHLAPEIKGRFLGGTVTVSGDGRSADASGTYEGGFTTGPYRIYAAMTLDQPSLAGGTWTGPAAAPVIEPGVRQRVSAGTLGAFWRFDGTKTPVVTVRIAVSLRSVEAARKHLAEVAGASFEQVRDRARAAWQQALGRIAVEGGPDAERRLFATCLYQSQLMPRDRTADHGGGGPWWDDHYATWDTWHTKLPLLALIDPAAFAQIVNSYAVRRAAGGTVADAFVAGNDGPIQGGDDVDNVIADAWAKQIPGIDWPQAYQVIDYHAEVGRTPEYRAQGWIPAGTMSCSRTLECAVNDWGAAQVARGLGHPQEADRWEARSHRWRELWNPALASDGFTGFVAPRRADGTWIEPFDPKQTWGSWVDYFYEGNAWEYTLTPFHDLDTLVQLGGGRERFLARLAHAMDAGLAHRWNEPSFLTAFLPVLQDDPALAVRLARAVRDGYTLTGGYPGNEDSGAMASWYVFASLGLFPVAGQDRYLITPPAFPRARITLPGNRVLTIERSRGSRVLLDGTPLPGWTIRHAQLTAASRLEIPGAP